MLSITSTVDFLEVKETFIQSTSSSSSCALLFRSSISSIFDITLSIKANVVFVSCVISPFCFFFGSSCSCCLWLPKLASCFLDLRGFLFCVNSYSLKLKVEVEALFKTMSF